MIRHEPSPTGCDSLGSVSLTLATESGLDAPSRPPVLSAGITRLVSAMEELIHDRAQGWVTVYRDR